VWDNKGQALLKHSVQDDWHVGYKLEHDVNANALKSALGLIALKNQKGDFFFRSDILKQHFTLGCNHRHREFTWHSLEFTYDHKQKIDGIYG
jgi:hypothetical protein